jgi:CDP-diacylglycerol--glycerol-3-phosphate 3-phosphatidyltransferase
MASALFASALAVSGLVLGQMEGAAWALRWTLGAAPVATYLLAFVRRRLVLNAAEAGDVPHRTLGPGTALTLGRGLIYAALAGLTLFPTWPGPWWAWAPGALFTTAALTDLFDGYLARRAGHATRLGAKLDVEVDALGILVATVLVVRLGQLPPVFLLTGVAYYAFRAWAAWRRRTGRPVHPLPYSPLRRTVGGFQVGFLCVILWPVFAPPATTYAGALFAALLALSFGRDVLFLSGRLDASAVAWEARWLYGHLAVASRTVAVAATARFLVYLPNDLGLGVVYGAATLFAACVAAGLTGRLAATGLLAVACVDLVLAGFSAPTMLLILSALAVMVCGTGARSIWQPSDRVLLRPLGSAAGRGE